MSMQKRRLICFNVHYSPESFGGATIVAEEVNRRLVKDYNWEILVITTRSDENFLPYHVVRYNTKDVSVISVNLPIKKMPDNNAYNNIAFESVIENLIESFKPDICHGHAVQDIGFNFATVMSRYSIPTVLTLHDCLWICEKQFMINNHGRYCNQNKINPSICMYCVPNPSLINKRKAFFNKIYSDIDMFLFPSSFHKNLHLFNGFNEKNCLVNKNGVTFPKSNFRKKKSDAVRFGFIGGPGYVKGAELIRKVFTKISGNFILKLVDAGVNLNQPWEAEFERWGIDEDKIQILQPYTQETIDEFFSQIDVLLFPSQWKESFGLTVREALVRDVWVIATNGGGTIEDIRDTLNGNVIPLNADPIFLKEAVIGCINKEWENYANNFKSDITSYDDQVAELVNIYSDIITVAERNLKNKNMMLNESE